MTDAPPQLDPTKVQAFVANAHGDLEVVRRFSPTSRASSMPRGTGEAETGRPGSAPQRTWDGATSRSFSSRAARD